MITRQIWLHILACIVFLGILLALSQLEMMIAS